MGALVICGLQFAPASHQAALGPGVVAAWVALLGFLVFAAAVLRARSSWARCCARAA